MEQFPPHPQISERGIFYPTGLIFKEAIFTMEMPENNTG